MRDDATGLTAATVTALLQTGSEGARCEHTSANLLEDPGLSTLMEPMRSRAWG
jgi:hypothetical protein